MYIYIYICARMYKHIFPSCSDCCWSVFLLVSLCMYVCAYMSFYSSLYLSPSMYPFLFLSLRLELNFFLFRTALLGLQRAHLFYPTVECLQHQVQVLQSYYISLKHQHLKPLNLKFWIAKPLNPWILNPIQWGVWLSPMCWQYTFRKMQSECDMTTWIWMINVFSENMIFLVSVACVGVFV